MIYNRQVLLLVLLAALAACMPEKSKGRPESKDPQNVSFDGAREPIVRSRGCISGPPEAPFHIQYEGRLSGDWGKSSRGVYRVKVLANECDLVGGLTGATGVHAQGIASCDFGSLACIELPLMQPLAVWRDGRMLDYPEARTFETTLEDSGVYLGKLDGCERYRIRGKTPLQERGVQQEYTFCPGRGVTEIVQMDKAGKPTVTFKLVSRYGVLSQAREMLTLHGY